MSQAASKLLIVELLLSSEGMAPGSYIMAYLVNRRGDFETMYSINEHYFLVMLWSNGLHSYTTTLDVQPSQQHIDAFLPYPDIDQGAMTYCIVSILYCSYNPAATDLIHGDVRHESMEMPGGYFGVNAAE